MGTIWKASLSEREFQDKIFTSKVIQENIIKALDLDVDNYSFAREVEFVNGITSDFIIFDNNNTMCAILECKRADIGVTEYVRGVGQLFQYEYFQEKRISPRRYSDINFVDELNINALVIPSSFIKNTALNIGLFKYPESGVILEIHERTKRVRCISTTELDKLAAANQEGISTICQYYVRDNRLFECYMALKVCKVLNHLNIVMNRTEIEHHILRKFKVINNQNWRNAFISLSSFGFIGRNSEPLGEGQYSSSGKVTSFIEEIYSEYIYPFIDMIMDVLCEEENRRGSINLSNKDIAERIRKLNHGNDILFLTDSDERYISSWLNIMRDDLGCINFAPRSKKRVIQYIPKELSKDTLRRKIEEYSNCREYVEEFEKNFSSVIGGLL